MASADAIHYAWRPVIKNNGAVDYTILPRTLAQPTLAACHGTVSMLVPVLLVQSGAAVQCSRSVSEEVKIPKGVEIVNDIKRNGEVHGFQWNASYLCHHFFIFITQWYCTQGRERVGIHGRHRARGSRQLGVHVCHCSLASVHSSAYPPRTPELADKLASYSTKASMVLYLEQEPKLVSPSNWVLWTEGKGEDGHIHLTCFGLGDNFMLLNREVKQLLQKILVAMPDPLVGADDDELKNLLSDRFEVAECW
ncbi:hypothetical protein SELMODRAFT_429114 [Selaginella moellendorffii]|uniref:Uncharacterized protein n=1 Tax=Selaginella moellendorffii TaxID=88036 RepID=D8T540_SELML|nr:hypothetical protein SELMODRAFT_429114 [Selaginella moellendorffii]